MADIDVKYGDAKTLRIDLERDLTAVDSARIVIARRAGQEAVVDRAGEIVTASGAAYPSVVELRLSASDFGAGDDKLQGGREYKLEVPTLTGDEELTHPDDGYLTLKVWRDLD